ncbi:glutaredoxin 3 [Candidatus Peregrinibacteria bacterium]|nr:glutaredoxin 3 [Candidatus Peregrinibacteria bacterium]
MTDITIYTKSYCPYCRSAKELLKSKGQTFTEIDVEHDEVKRQEMIQKSGGRMTVPQIFIDGKHIGGFDDLSALDTKGALDPMLKKK